MQRIAIFDYYLGGHHLEYLHHLYCGAIARPDIDFIFIVPTSFSKFSSRLPWKECNNIDFLFFECDEIRIRRMNIYKKAFYLSSKLASIVREEKLEYVVLLETMVYMPFLPFLVPCNVNFSSIIYLISTFRSHPSFITRCFDAFKYKLISYFNCFDRVYLLNDRESEKYYNSRYKVSKFAYLPDPYFPISIIDNKNLREQFNISSEKKILLHFGGLTKRKGTIEILKALELLDRMDQEHYCMIFAGRVIEDIRTEFYSLIEHLKMQMQILVFDEFCRYDFLGLLCSNADCILIPYKNSAQSSGLLAYAAQFRVPVIGPQSGLIGSIIKTYEMGVTIDTVDSLSISKALMNFTVCDINEQKAQLYIEDNTINKFVDTIFSCIELK